MSDHNKETRAGTNDYFSDDKPDNYFLCLIYANMLFHLHSEGLMCVLVCTQNTQQLNLCLT